eukprot:1154747-Pelagomonas_calceolata.AAC.3
MPTSQNLAITVQGSARWELRVEEGADAYFTQLGDYRTGKRTLGVAAPRSMHLHQLSRKCTTCHLPWVLA